MSRLVCCYSLVKYLSDFDHFFYIIIMITSTESQGRLPRYDSRDKITKIIMITTIWGNHQIRNRKTARKTEFHQHALGYRNGHPDILYPDIGIWYMIAAAFFAAGCMRTCLGQRLAVSKLVQQFLVVSKNLGEWPKKRPTTMMSTGSASQNGDDSMKPSGSRNQNRYFAACESTWNFPLRRWVENQKQPGPA